MIVILLISPVRLKRVRIWDATLCHGAKSFFLIGGVQMKEWRKRSLLDLGSLSADAIQAVLTDAQTMKAFVARGNKKTDLLRGKSIVNLFLESSTRTRSSFELAGKYLGADVINVSSSGSSMNKGESLRDTLLALTAMGPDVIVMRHHVSGAAVYAAKIGETMGSFPAIINAGDGQHAHPSQGLLDLFTVYERKGSIKGIKYVIIGDIRHSRVARSDIAGFLKMGAEVHLVGPRTLIPAELEREGVILHTRLETALADADAIQVLRVQHERAAAGFIPNNREYARHFGLNTARLHWAKPDVVVMHPGPMNRGVEISHELAYAENALVQTQVENGLAVRMAILNLILNGGNGIETLT